MTTATPTRNETTTTTPAETQVPSAIPGLVVKKSRLRDLLRKQRGSIYVEHLAVVILIACAVFIGATEFAGTIKAKFTDAGGRVKAMGGDKAPAAENPANPPPAAKK